MVEPGKAARRNGTGAKPARLKRKPVGAPPVHRAVRPKRPKKTLVDDFAAVLRADFRTHGAGVIAAVRAEKPEHYLKVVLTMLPKDFSQDLDASENNNLEHLSDEEIKSRIRGLEASLRPLLDAASLSGAAGGGSAETQPQSAGSL